ncbi:MAG: barstar family protein [Lachnospiraceae bacterium]|nr:barstar family protein [Lachnospiraceae bacterium]
MNEYTVDIKDVTTRKQLHERLKNSLGFEEYYGANLDALHDALTDLPTGTVIRITGFEEAALSLESYATSFRRVCEDVQKEREDMEIRWE